jgi:transmembrane sensor
MKRQFALRQAAAWWVRLDAGRVASGDRGLRRFLASPQHREAYERTHELVQMFELPHAAEELADLRVAAVRAKPAVSRWPKMAAAGLLLALLPTAALFKGRTEAPAIERFATAPDESRTVILADGSKVTLSINTQLAVAYDSHERRITLSRGEAMFVVARNPARPFVVDAGELRVAAVGTEFNTRVERDEVEVVLIEGRVHVTKRNRALPAVPGGPDAPLELHPGERLLLAGQVPQVSRVDAGKFRTWTDGLMAFENETLPAAVARFNRYSERQVVAADPALQSLRIGGVFKTGRPEHFAEVLAQMLPVAAEADPQGRIVLRPRDSAQARHP